MQTKRTTRNEFRVAILLDAVFVQFKPEKKKKKKDIYVKQNTQKAREIKIKSLEKRGLASSCLSVCVGEKQNYDKLVEELRIQVGRSVCPPVAFAISYVW